MIGKSFPIAVVFCLFVKRNNLSIKAKAYCYLKKTSTHPLTVLIIRVIVHTEQRKREKRNLPEKVLTEFSYVF